jgi:hypothetical protein
MYKMYIHYAVVMISTTSFNWANTLVVMSLPFTIHGMGTIATQYARH